MNIIQKLIAKIVKKSVQDAVSNNAVVPVEGGEVMNDPKKNIWKFVIQTLISILTAILTALGATSCVNAL